MANLTCPSPANLNPLSQNGFQFGITKLPDVNFFCQEANVPDVKLESPMQGTPFVDVPIPGEKLTYGTLDIKFLVDEDMFNYKALYNWMKGLGFPHDYQQYIDFQKRDPIGLTKNELTKNYSDAVLQILSSSNNARESTTVRFVDIFPVSLDQLTFTSTNTDVVYITANASFKISYYEFLA